MARGRGDRAGKPPGAPARPGGVSDDRLILAHDCFNVVCIAGLNALNFVNWRRDAAAWAAFRPWESCESWAARWSGEYHRIFVISTFVYMMTDLLWVVLVPQCVAASRARPIIIHHVAAAASMAVPWWHGSTHGYTLGVFLLADINTFFLVLKNLLKRSKAPLPSLAFAVVSACFYASWVVIRLVLFPTWLFTISGAEWAAAWRRTGAPVNLFVLMPLANFCGVYLNYQWTWELVSGVLRRRRRPAGEWRRDLERPLIPGERRAHAA